MDGFFPVSENSARIGVCTVFNCPEKVPKKNIKFWLGKFLGEDSPIHTYVKYSQPYAIHVGYYPLCGMIEKPYANNVLIAGDAAAQASMLLGEGIRFAMQFGKIASLTAIEAIKNKNISEDSLKVYKERCMSYLGEYYDVAIDLLRVSTDEYWENLIDAIYEHKNKNPNLVLKYLKTALTYKEAKELFPSFVGKYFRK